MLFQASPYFPDNQPEMYRVLQNLCNRNVPNQLKMIELYCCGPGLLFWLLLFQIRTGLGSSRF